MCIRNALESQLANPQKFIEKKTPTHYHRCLRCSQINFCILEFYGDNNSFAQVAKCPKELP